MRIRSRLYGRALAGIGLLVLLVVAPTTAADADGPQVPDAPMYFQLVTQTATQLSFSWDDATTYDAPVTGYQFQQSTDDATTWSTVTSVTGTGVTVAAPGPARFVDYRVIAQSDAGPSSPSYPLGVATPGTRTQRVTIRTSTGQPVTGGDVRWSDGYGTWSPYNTLTLNAGGVVDLPNVPAGTGMSLQVTDANMSTDVHVSKTWSVDFGVDPQTLIVPPPPAKESHKITVLMPNGVPVVHAEVNAMYKLGVYDVIERDGYTYDDYSIANEADRFTGQDGSTTVRGFSTEGMEFIPAPEYPWPEQAVYVYYNDGVLHQDGTFLMTGAETTVHLDLMPWFTADSPAPATVGKTVSVVFKAHGSAAKSAHARSGSTKLSGMLVALKPPAGWSAKRCVKKSKLSGTTNTRGRVRLTVCGSKSGTFLVRSAGAVPTGSITIHVKHAPPMAPAKVAASSPGSGQLAVSWTRPSYAGGATVTSYRVTATAGSQSRFFIVRGAQLAKGLKYTFSGLTHAKVWRVSVQAATRYGIGDPANTSARVS